MQRIINIKYTVIQKLLMAIGNANAGIKSAIIVINNKYLYIFKCNFINAPLIYINEFKIT